MSEHVRQIILYRVIYAPSRKLERKCVHRGTNGPGPHTTSQLFTRTLANTTALKADEEFVLEAIRRASKIDEALPHPGYGYIPWEIILHCGKINDRGSDALKF